MSQKHTIVFRESVGSIVGTYIPIEYGDNVLSVDMTLSHTDKGFITTDNGRIVTAAYWVVDSSFNVVDSSFNRDKLILHASDSKVHYCNDISTNVTGNRLITIDGRPYVDTKLIPKHTLEKFTFKFPALKERIHATQIFFAIVSTPDPTPEQPNDFRDLYTHSLCVGIKETGSYYYRSSGGIDADTPLKVSNLMGLDISNVKVEHLTQDTGTGTSIKPSKIECSDLRYRTYSQGSYNPGDKNESRDGWGDGGETYADAYNKVDKKNKTVKEFASDFDINEGRLKDVIFAKPEQGSNICVDNNGNAINEARWVFKRSRIKFTIPPVRNSKGDIQQTPIVLRYKIEAGIHDTSGGRDGDNNKKVYRNEYVTKQYSKEDSKKDITLVICPRDEGIKDNTEFKVILDRRYVGSENYSDPAVYYFRTYQKPIINIAYPKIIRNKSTGTGFKYTKIPTNNIFSNFKGENSIVNKYVADTLNILTAAPKPDASGIPLFIRFYIAEYKFGRNGCLMTADDLNTNIQAENPYYGKPVKFSRDENGAPILNSSTGLPEDLPTNKYELNSEWKFHTIQDVYKSNYTSDYVTKDDILNGTASPTAFATRILNSDGNPILLSGRLTNKNIEDLITSATGEKLQLWTYRNWDYVIEDSDTTEDIKVGNAWPLSDCERDENGHEIRYNEDYTTRLDYDSKDYKNSIYKKIITSTQEIVGDHLGASYYKKTSNAGINDTSDSAYALEKVDENTYKRIIKQDKSTAIIFRAGYVYMIRMRMFHGAAAGAIGSKYGGITSNDRKSILYGYGSNNIYYPNSGSYDYSNAITYGGRYPYIKDNNGNILLNDISTNTNILYGKEEPYKYHDIGWMGPDDGTTGLSLNSDDLNKTYPGFSEVDSTIFETVAPYTSQTNLITVHPTSPQIGVNQWLSFNYRHLSKNIGGVEAFATTKDEQGNYISHSKSFGFTPNDILNTVSRITAMHTSCVEAILTAFANKRGKTSNITDDHGNIIIDGTANKKDTTDAYIDIWKDYNKCDKTNTKPDVVSEKITLWIRRPHDRELLSTDDNNIAYSNYNHEYVYVESERTWRTTSGGNANDIVLNVPLINRFEVADDNTTKIFNDNEFYTGGNIEESETGSTIGYGGDRQDVEPYKYLVRRVDNEGNVHFDEYQGESACYAYNQFRKQFEGDRKTRNTYFKYKDTGNPETERHPETWPEIKIIYLAHKWDNSYQGEADRKRPLIDPLGNTYRWQPVINAQASNMEELQIEGTQAINAYKGANTVNIYIANDNSDIIEKIKDEKGNPIDIPVNRIKNKIGKIAEIPLLYTGDAPNQYDVQTKYFYKDEYQMENECITSNNEEKRFTIKEFAGYTLEGNHESSGWPAMYTIISNKHGAYGGNDKFIKYFSVTLALERQYGMLYSRVPVSQDCENGDITAYNGSYNDSNLPNIGGLVIKNNNNQVAIDNDFNNSIPLVRTTHYLYFKTWINTVYSMKVEVQLKCYKDVAKTDSKGNVITDSEGNTIYEAKPLTDNISGTVCFDGNEFSKYDTDKKSPLIYFGNKLGLSEVYGEDNYGWGRCLSADDIRARKIKYDGTINDKTKSGGVEVPIMVRYTPLLQPQLAHESIDSGDGTITIIHNKTNTQNIYYSRDGETRKNEKCNVELCVQEVTSWESIIPESRFTYEDNGYSILENVTALNLNIYYPYIPEDYNYYTVSPNGGVSGNVYYDGYYIDADSDPSKTVDTNISSTDATNLDFFGGYGLCTAYTVLLVPSDPDLPDKDSDEYKNYFKNTDGHWNYYKQPANYYDTNDIFKIKSKSITDAGPVLVAYAIKPDDTGSKDPLNKFKINYINHYSSKEPPDTWTPPEVDAPNIWQVSHIKGRAFKSVKLDFKNLFEGKILVGDSNTSLSIDDFNKRTDIEIELTPENNVLKIGLSYDLVIVPIYDNTVVSQYDYLDAERISDSAFYYHGAGSINGRIYGSGTFVNSTNKECSYKDASEFKTSDSSKTIRLCGSNPLVSFNYLQIGSATVTNNIVNDHKGDRPGHKDKINEYLEECSQNCHILSTDHAIIYPNVDSELYNSETGNVKESPGFWLNNSFKLVLRMPSFRTIATQLNGYDLNTIEHMSNGILNNSNTADDFEFDDIQIHIGKLSELKIFGYPNKMDGNLNTLTSMEDLAKAHIISYKHYWNKGVFSKKLKNWDTEYGSDDRDKVTGGALTPDNSNYEHRFIEVNLSNCKIMDGNGNMVPIYTIYPEGYYIQFRWRSAYATGNDGSQWSAWHGGSCNGGQIWWGDKGTDYYVPVRNYTDIHTEFRNYIKESYPGSLINYKIDGNEGTIGKGSNMKYGSYSTTDRTENINANNSTNKAFIGDELGPNTSRYYHNGSINKSTSKIVPSVNPTLDIPKVKISDNQEIELKNTDNPYSPQYMITHDTAFTIPDNITSFNQQMWEMLYIDYIITNMCRLYYKPKHNDIVTLKYGSNNIKTYKGCNLAAPWEKGKPKVLNYKFAGWSDLEEFFITDEGKREIKLGPNYSESNTSGRKWNRNKYYRKTINKQDFDALNEALEGLITFTRDKSLAGKYVKDNTKIITDNETTSMIDALVIGNSYVLLKDIASIEFKRNKKLLIGNGLDSTTGHGIENNINHKMVSSNYIQNLWNNILTVCSTGDRIKEDYPSTKVTINKE